MPNGRAYYGFETGCSGSTWYRTGEGAVGAWIVLLFAAAPFAAKQTDHLASGGFEVPGSESEVVDRNLERFEGAQRESLAVVLAKREGATGAAGHTSLRVSPMKYLRLFPLAVLAVVTACNEAARTPTSPVDGPDFKPGTGAHFSNLGASIDLTGTDQGDLLVSFRESGLGNSPTPGSVQVEVTAQASAEYACVNGGNNHPKAANKETITAPVGGTGDFPIGNNGSACLSLPWRWACFSTRASSRRCVVCLRTPSFTGLRRE